VVDGAQAGSQGVLGPKRRNRSREAAVVFAAVVALTHRARTEHRLGELLASEQADPALVVLALEPARKHEESAWRAAELRIERASFDHLARRICRQQPDRRTHRPGFHRLEDLVRRAGAPGDTQALIGSLRGKLRGLRGRPASEWASFYGDALSAGGRLVPRAPRMGAATGPKFEGGDAGLEPQPAAPMARTHGS
jgi:hypothetical protein